MNNFLLKLASLSSRQTLLLAAIVAGFWYLTLYNDGSELSAKLNHLKSQVSTERAKEAESDAALKEIASVQASVGVLLEQFRAVSAQLPTDIQMAEIIRTVDKVAQATGLMIDGKEPKVSIRQDVIEILPLHVMAQGTFSEITMFFYYLSTIERIVRVKSFTMTASEDPRKNTRLKLDADIVSYKFLPGEAAKR